MLRKEKINTKFSGKFFALLLISTLITVSTFTLILSSLNPNKVQASSELAITFPESTVSAEPNVASLTIHDDPADAFDAADFTIPYIQTSSTLPVTATVDSVPAGGGVKFVLNEGLSGEQTLYDTTGTSPFSVSFNDLAKGTYTLDTYVVDSSHVVQSGVDKHDFLTDIGIGDIITCIGDSLTAGYWGADSTYPPAHDWTEADPEVTSADRRNYQQQGPSNDNYSTAYQSELNDSLSAQYGYPVFLMNEGIGAITGSSFSDNMETTDWQNREVALEPNRWIVHFGVNESGNGVDDANYIAGIKSITDKLISNYSARPADIIVTKPLYVHLDSVWNDTEATYLPALDNFIATEGFVKGPDFFNYFADKYPAMYVENYHVNTAGFSAMAELLRYSTALPLNVDYVKVGTNYTISWADLSADIPEVSGYKLMYGTSPGVYTTTVDVGDNLEETVTGLTPGEEYYFAVQAYYDNTVSDVTPESAISPDLRVLVDGPPSVVTDVTAVAASRQATVSFTPPATDGNHNITMYHVTSSPGGIVSSGTASPITITGLTNGTAYTFTVTATNSQGDSIESEPSNEVTPPINSDLELEGVIDNPENMISGGSVSYTVTINNLGDDDIDLTAFDDPNTPLLAGFIPSSDLQFTGFTTTTDADCTDGGLVGDSPAAPYFPNHADYNTLTCLYSGDGILQEGESITITLNFSVKPTFHSSFSAYFFNIATPNDPDTNAINAVFGGGPDFLDGFLQTDINNVLGITYTAPVAENDNSNNKSLADKLGVTGQVAPIAILVFVAILSSLSAYKLKRRNQ